MDGESRYQPGRNPTQERQPETVSKFNAEIQALIDQRPFESEINYSILMDLQENIPKKIDFNDVPKLQLWKLSEEIRKIDDNDSTAEKIVNHGILLQETAIYIAHKVDNGIITSGRNTAVALSEQLFNYGKSLVNGKPDKTLTTFDTIVGRNVDLSDQQTKVVEHLLTIDKLSQTSNSSKDLILSQFFYDIGSSAAFLGNHHYSHTEQITEALEMAITIPVSQLENFIIQQKIKVLSERIPLDLESITQKIAENFNIDISKLSHKPRTDVLKQIFEHVRTRSDIPAEEIGDWEQKVAEKILKSTSPDTIQKRFENHDHIYRPDNKTYYISATTLGAALMKQVGIKCLIENTPKTTKIFLETTDKRFILMDMAYVLGTYTVTDNIHKTPLPHQTPGPEGLIIDSPIEEGGKKHFTIYTPEEGQKILTLLDYAIDHYKKTSYPFPKGESTPEKRLKNYQLSIRTFEKIITSNLQDEDIWYRYGQALLKYATDTEVISPSKEEKKILFDTAVKAFTTAAKLNPHNQEAHKQAQKADKLRKTA